MKKMKKKNPLEGTAQRHGRIAGYVVCYNRGGLSGPMKLCHGERIGRDKLLFGNPATLFPTRARANRAIRHTVADDPNFFTKRLWIMPVCEPAPPEAP